MSSPSGAKTPEQISAEVTERIRLAGVAAQKQAEVGAANAAPPPAAAQPTPAPIEKLVSMTQEQLEAEIERVLGVKAKKKQEEVSTPSPSINWSKLSEKEALDISNPLNIPVIVHEVPGYMDLVMKDPEYVCVWANRDQRRLGQLLAEGYELLKREHIHPNFQIPLKFDSEGLYIYQDVIAMRVHKSILYPKRRKVVEQSYAQLKGPRALAKAKLARSISNDSRLEEAFETGSMGYYEPSEPGN